MIFSRVYHSNEKMKILLYMGRLDQNKRERTKPWWMSCFFSLSRSVHRNNKLCAENDDFKDPKDFLCTSKDVLLYSPKSVHILSEKIIKHKMKTLDLSHVNGPSRNWTTPKVRFVSFRNINCVETSIMILKILFFCVWIRRLQKIVVHLSQYGHVS